MYKVKLIGPGLKIENKWYWIGETAIVNEEDYEKNKKYLEVIEIIKDEKDTGKVEDKNKDEEMELLRKKAAELGIEFGKNTKKETLIKKINEIENK